MSDIPEVCLGCGEFLVLLPWNEETDFLICDNVKCNFFHSPNTSVTKGSWQAPDRKESSIFSSSSGGGNVSAISSFNARLQRMQEELYSEE